MLKAFFKRAITKEQCKDTGMAMVLILLLLSIRWKREGLIVIAALALVINMVVPQAYRQVTVLWLGLSHILGTVMSKLLLTIVFFFLVTPIGLIRRLLGRDSLRLKEFKMCNDSVMVSRNHTFIGNDMDRPY